MTTKKVQASRKKVQASRRQFVKRAAYVPPAILTLAVAPSYAKAGSEKAENGLEKAAKKAAEKGKK